MRRWIMHVDMDAFYASVEQRDHPEYQGQPVIVGGLSSRGVVATASYEARAFGVHSAMPIARARQLCPEGIYLWPRIDHYRAVSVQIHEVMERFTPYIEPLSLDEAFLEVTGMAGLYEGPKALGQAIKDQIFAATGLVVSAGLAPNKYLAKLASDWNKPDGLTVIPYGREQAFLAPLDIRFLWGVGRQTAARLREDGFDKIGQIATLPGPALLVPSCGNQAQRIYDMSRGIDDRPVEYDRQAQSIGNEETYSEDISDEAFIDREWRYFAHRVARRLRRAGLTGHTIAIKIRFDDFSTITRQRTLDLPSDSEDTLYQNAKLLYNKVKLTGPIRLLGLSVSGLSTSVVQDSLFAVDQGQSRLTEALDGLEDRFGEGVVLKGSLWERRKALARPEREMQAKDSQEKSDAGKAQDPTSAELEQKKDVKKQQ